MEARKKIVICAKCRFFPTKVDQPPNHQLQVGSQSIRWTCQACYFQNIFPKSEFIMLPERNYLKFHHTGLLSSQSKNRTYNFLIILQDTQQAASQEVVYTVPADKAVMEEQLKRDLGMLNSYQQLQEKSQWLRFYRKRKAALMKFTQNKLENKQKIFRDEFSIFLLEKYLKNQIVLMSEQEEIAELRVDIILQTKENPFYFQLDSLELDLKESSLQRFLTIYLLSVLQEQPTWASQLYSKQIQFHQKKPSLKQYYQKLIVFPEGSGGPDPSILVKKHLYTTRSPNIVPQILSNRTSFISKSNFQQFEVYPLSESSFLLAIRPKMKKQVHLTESVDIFCSARRSKDIERITLTKNLSSLRKILLNPKENRIEVSEQEFKKLIGSQMESIKGNKFLKLIKLVGSFAVDGSRVFVLYTFDWEKMENKKGGASFEEPKTYRDVLREEILREKPEKNVNPFAKKKKKVEVVEVWTAKPQKEDYDYISL